MKRSTLSLMIFTAQTLLEQASTQFDNGDNGAADDTLAALGKVLRFEPEEDEDGAKMPDHTACVVPGCPEPATIRVPYLCDTHLHQATREPVKLCRREGCFNGASRGGYCDEHDYMNDNPDGDPAPKPKRQRKPRKPRSENNTPAEIGAAPVEAEHRAQLGFNTSADDDR